MSRRSSDSGDSDTKAPQQRSAVAWETSSRGSGSSDAPAEAASPQTRARAPFSSGAHRKLERRKSRVGMFAPDELAPDGTPKKNKMQFDLLTIRRWFDDMDEDSSGTVSKKEWVDFLRKNQSVKQFLLFGRFENPVLQSRDRFSAERVQKQREEAKHMRKLFIMWKDLDADDSGNLEFTEFVELFRRSGNLLEYHREDNPRVRLANTITQLRNDAESVDRAALEEFEQVCAANLESAMRRTMEREVLSLANLEEPEIVEVCNRISQRQARVPGTTRVVHKNSAWASPRSRTALPHLGVGSPASSECASPRPMSSGMQPWLPSPYAQSAPATPRVARRPPSDAALSAEPLSPGLGGGRTRDRGLAQLSQAGNLPKVSLW